MNYDAILVTSFGGPEGPDDVMPFLENVLRGKNLPRERMLEVAEHYYHFGEDFLALVGQLSCSSERPQRLLHRVRASIPQPTDLPQNHSPERQSPQR